MLDTSYERSYLALPEDWDDEGAADTQYQNKDTATWTDKEILEMNHALERIRGWDFRSAEEWVRDTLIPLVSEDLHYDHLPSRYAWDMRGKGPRSHLA